PIDRGRYSVTDQVLVRPCRNKKGADPMPAPFYESWLRGLAANASRARTRDYDAFCGDDRVLGAVPADLARSIEVRKRAAVAALRGIFPVVDRSFSGALASLSEQTLACCHAFERALADATTIPARVGVGDRCGNGQCSQKREAKLYF